MTRVPFIALALLVASAPAFADDFSSHRDTRAFWRKDQPWHLANGGQNAEPRFTMTYTEGLARRLGADGDHLDLLQQRAGGPGLVGTVDHGTPSLELRWHPGE